MCTHATEMVTFQNPAAGFSTGIFSFHGWTTTVVEMLWSSSSCNNLLQQKCSFVEPPTSSVVLQTSVSYIFLYIVVLVFILNIFRNRNPQTSSRKCSFDNQQNVLVLLFRLTCVKTVPPAGKSCKQRKVSPRNKTVNNGFKKDFTLLITLH